MSTDWPVVFGSILVSVLLIPAMLYLLLPVRTTQPGSPALIGVGTAAMLPGFLMGAMGLWVAARS